MNRCAACGGQVKLGLYGRECMVCGNLPDSVEETVPCHHGVVVAGKNKCRTREIPDKTAGEVYSFLIGGNDCPMSSKCPGFKVAGPAKDAPQEDRDNWDRAKEIVGGQTEKGQDDFSDQEWGLVTHIWKGMKGHHPPKSKAAQVEGCQYLDGSDCVQPYFDLDDEGTPVRGTERVISLGECLFVGDLEKQDWCPISLPLPDFEKAASEFGDRLLPVFAHWVDVRNKAIRIRRESGVKILRNDAEVIVASVRGDNDEYVSTLYRQDGGWSITTWECTCFPSGTPILMADGTFKSIEDVRVGDEVVTHLGNIQRVTKTMDREYKGDLVSVVPYGFTSDTVVEMTPDHPVLSSSEVRCPECSKPWNDRKPWNCEHTSKSVDFVEAGTLEAGQSWVVTPVIGGQCSPLTIDMSEFVDDFVEVEGGKIRSGSVARSRGRRGVGRGTPIPRHVSLDEDLAWLFGMYLAEGGVYKEGDFRFALHEDELEYAARLSDILESKFGLDSGVTKSGSGRSISVVAYSTIVSQMLCSLLGKGHSSKHVDRRLMTQPPEIQEAILRGWLDGDAGTTVNRDMMSQMRHMLLRIGRVSGVSSASAESQSNELVGQNAQRCYRLSRVYWDSLLSGQGIRRFMGEHGQMSRVESVRRRPFSGKVYNLEVEGDNSYVAGEIAVHNCAWGDWAFNRKRFFGRMCSHAYATLMQAQAEKMTGPGSTLYQHQYVAAIKEGSMAGEICEVCTKEAYDLVDEPLTEQRVCVSCMDSLTRQAAVRVKLGARGFERDFLEMNMTEESVSSLLSGIRVSLLNSGRFAHVEYGDGSAEVIPMSQVEVEASAQENGLPQLEGQASVGYDEPVDDELLQLQAVFSNNPDFQEFQAKTASREFSFSEQQELQEEGQGSLARNIDRIRTEGSHFDESASFEDEDASGLFW